MIKKNIYIRNEININEKRSPIVPYDICKLINFGYKVWVQKSFHRIFTNEEYENNGAIITELNWFDPKFKDFIIVGLKELDNLDKLNSHTHLYFSHSFQNQLGSNNILNKFANTNSRIIDFEYILGNNNKRIISFGYYAGLVGGGLGIVQYFLKQNNSKLSNLLCWNNIKIFYDFIEKNINLNLIPDIKICIIGSNGNTGIGVKYILNKYNFKFDCLYRNFNPIKLFDYDIIFNCIKLDELYNNIWFDNSNIVNISKNFLIIDISCDVTKPNNPIKIYNSVTNWNNPVYSLNNYIDIISIDNLPSLLPCESSINFSKQLIELLKNNNSDYWSNCLEIYNDNIKNIKNI